MKEEKVQKPVEEKSRPRKTTAKEKRPRTTLAVSMQTREEIHVLSFWAQRHGITHLASSESLLRVMLDDFYEKHPKAKKYVDL